MSSREFQTLRRLFARLSAKKCTLFPPKNEKLMAPKKPGVYVIYSPRGRVMHVGRTTRGKQGLHQRLRNHLQGQSSFTAACFERDGSRLRKSYSYSCIEVADPRVRALLEAYAIGRLCPAHIGVGKIEAG